MCGSISQFFKDINNLSFSILKIRNDISLIFSKLNDIDNVLHKIDKEKILIEREKEIETNEAGAKLYWL